MEGPPLKISEALAGVRTLFFDTAPIIYHVELSPRYGAIVGPIFDRVSDGDIEAVTSRIALAECLVQPYKKHDLELVERFRGFITRGRNTRCVGVDPVMEAAAELRARYNLSLTDALQVAAAVAEGCDAILTNDIPLKRVKEIRIILVDDLEL